VSHPVRLGIIGLGRVFERYAAVIDPIVRAGRAEVICAYDPQAERGDVASQIFPGVRILTSAEAVIADPEVDAVLVLTSMNEHGDLGIASYSAGKHVLIEKPMATSMDQAAELVRLSQDSDRIMVCAPHVLLSPTYREMHRRLRAGEIGDVKLARALYGWSGPWWGEWFYQPGGGSLFDLGVYNVTTLCGFLGSVKRVTALVGTAIKERMVNGEPMTVTADDNAQVLLDFGDEVYASVTTGFTIQKYGRAPAVELYGLEGSMDMLGDDWAPRGFEMWRNETGRWEIHEETAPDWPWTDGVAHLVSCIERGVPSVTRPEQAYHVLDVMLAAMRSAEEGRAIDITSKFPEPDYSHESDFVMDERRKHDTSR
jgi:predicted dehydrogenase